MFVGATEIVSDHLFHIRIYLNYHSKAKKKRDEEGNKHIAYNAPSLKFLKYVEAMIYCRGLERGGASSPGQLPNPQDLSRVTPAGLSPNTLLAHRHNYIELLNCFLVKVVDLEPRIFDDHSNQEIFTIHDWYNWLETTENRLLACEQIAKCIKSDILFDIDKWYPELKPTREGKSVFSSYVVQLPTVNGMFVCCCFSSLLFIIFTIFVCCSYFVDITFDLFKKAKVSDKNTKNYSNRKTKANQGPNLLGRRVAAPPRKNQQPIVQPSTTNTPQSIM